MAAVAAIFFLALNNGLGEASARTMAFTTIVISNLALITVNRSWKRSFIETLRRRNRAFWWVLVIAVIALVLVIYLSPLASLFTFRGLTPVYFDICVAAAFFSVVCSKSTG